MRRVYDDRSFACVADIDRHVDESDDTRIICRVDADPPLDQCNKSKVPAVTSRLAADGMRLVVANGWPHLRHVAVHGEPSVDAAAGDVEILFTDLVEVIKEKIRLALSEERLVIRHGLRLAGGISRLAQQHE